jgi:hypothetical protein
MVERHAVFLFAPSKNGANKPEFQAEPALGLISPYRADASQQEQLSAQSHNAHFTPTRIMRMKLVSPISSS